MYSSRLIILLFFVACKAISPSPARYSEDLSIYRPKIIPTEDSKKRQHRTEPYIPLTGHIKQELDSISKIAHTENKKNKYVDGYIIQVYSGNSREEANRIQSKIQKLFPDLLSKISYYQPNFRVKVGKFTNRLNAFRIHDQIKRKFVKSMVLPEKILLKYE